MDIIDEQGTEVIPRDSFEKVLRLAYMQDLGFKLKVSDIVDLIYTGGSDDQSVNKILEIANN